MSREENEPRRSVLLSVRFLVPAVFGSVLMILVAAFGTTAVQLALIGCFVSIIGGLALTTRRVRHRVVVDERSAVPPRLTSHAELARLYRVVSEALIAVADQPEGNRKDAAAQQLVALGVQFRAVASGTGARGGSESWYVAHDAVLGSPDLREYRAVVRVQTAECVRDPAVQESLRATFAAVRRGVFVERILVLPELLWPVGSLLPSDAIMPWIEEQHNHRLRTVLVREGDLATDQDPLTDTCVFADWAVGTRVLDDHSQTVHVALDFTPATIRAALDRLDRLSNLGISFRELLVRADAAD